jgi:hypothetical protein
MRILQNNDRIWQEMELLQFLHLNVVCQDIPWHSIAHESIAGKYMPRNIPIRCVQNLDS